MAMSKQAAGFQGRLARVPVDIFNMLLSFLSKWDHASLASTSSKFGKALGNWEQTILSHFQGLTTPDTHASLFAGDYIWRFTRCLELRPIVFGMSTREIQAIAWNNYHIGYNLLKSAECGPQRQEEEVFATAADTPYQVPATQVPPAQVPPTQVPAAQASSTTTNEDVGSDATDNPPVADSVEAQSEVCDLSEPVLRDSLIQAFELACAVLLRAHQASQKPESHPPLLEDGLAAAHPTFHCDVVNVMFHSLRFIHGKPECRHLWDKVKATLRQIIPERLSLLYLCGYM